MRKSTGSIEHLTPAELGPAAPQTDSHPLPLNVPTWVRHLLAAKDRPPCRLFHGSIPSARALPPESLRQRVASLYSNLIRESRDAGLLHLVRAWNAMPGITEEIGAGTSPTERYMAFNAGRHDALQAALRDFARDLPAATGVGTVDDADEVRVALLASSEAGIPIGNPKQVPAFKYSERYGKLPPCFARATLWAGNLFISGTAAITGEDTRFEQDLSAQTQLTLDNLAEVVRNAETAGFQGRGLRSLTDVRVYLPPATTTARDRQVVYQRLRNVSPSSRIDFVAAPLCRRNLLVEIEALAKS